MSLTPRLNRPEYLFNPRAVFSRLRHRGRNASPADRQTVTLPWSRQLTVFPDELGRIVTQTGVFDICVTETIYRLVDRDDLCVDVGANVGYVTSLMATRAGPGGSVIAFEPHPDIFALLEENARRWDAESAIAAVDVHRIALSDRPGTGHLRSPGTEGTHMGLSSLRGEEEAPASTEFEVSLGTLDECLADADVQILKIDVEGHEASVLEGAERLLTRGRIRDIVFEEHGIYPTPSMTYLESKGMTVLTLKHSPLALRVHPVQEGPAPAAWPGPNYLATRDPGRALRRLKPRGWQSLGGVARLGRRAS